MATKPLDWSKRALADRDAIFTFYAETASVLVASRAREAIQAATRTLCGNPLAYRMGRRGTREYVMRTFPYIVIYRVYPARIRVVRVLHQARDYFRGSQGGENPTLS